MKPVILTSYNFDIDEKIYHYQSMVINKFRNGIPYVPVRYPYSENELLHGDVTNKLVHDWFYGHDADCILIMDIDCIPLNKECFDITFDLAYKGNLVGNIQRSNHINNNQHTYCGAPYVCFTRELYEATGCPTMRYTHHGDNCEQLTYNCERLNIPVIKFMPFHSEMPINEQGEYWPLADGMPKYGIGTTYHYNGLELNYHLFSSRQHKFNKLFFEKCHKILIQ